MVTALQALNGTWPGVTVNVGLISGGTRQNVVPAECSLEIDLRSTRPRGARDGRGRGPREARPAIYDDITTDLELTGRHWPMEKLERSGRLVGHAVALAAALGLHDAATGGASDANTTAGMGVPTIDGLGPIGGYEPHRRTSTSRQPRSCRARRSSPGSSPRSGGTPRSGRGGWSARRPRRGPRTWREPPARLDRGRGRRARATRGRSRSATAATRARPTRARTAPRSIP